MAIDPHAPVTAAKIGATSPREAPAPLRAEMGLCLSGGGYRAMLFHVGALWRLQEARLLDPTAGAPLSATHGPLGRVSSVSGGSITSGVMGMSWAKVKASDPDPAVRLRGFQDAVADPVRAMSRVTIAGLSASGALKVIGAVILPGSVNDYVTRKYEKHLFGGATLQSLPDAPRFVINASNLQSGAVWRMSKPFMWDWRVGKIENPKLPLARAVAASSAFPPVLSPAVLKFDHSDFVPGTGGGGDDDLQRPPFTTRVELSDGGVYDNLGLETVWKQFGTVLVSDAGKPFAFDEKVPVNWLSQSNRVIGVVDNQVRSLRKRLLIDSYKSGKRKGCYWGIDADIAEYPCPSPLPCPIAKTRELATMGTDLEEKDEAAQTRLINWGYAICDAAIRSYLDPSIKPPTAFPYPGGVG